MGLHGQDLGGQQRRLPTDAPRSRQDGQVFSRDGTRLASGAGDGTVKFWEVSSGACLRTLHIGRALENITFDHTDSYLLTEIDTLVATAASSLSPWSSQDLMSVMDPQKPRFRSCGISRDNEWITYNSVNLLWLPPEYRPSKSAVLGHVVGASVGTGKIWICGFKSDTT